MKASERELARLRMCEQQCLEAANKNVNAEAAATNRTAAAGYAIAGAIMMLLYRAEAVDGK